MTLLQMSFLLLIFITLLKCSDGYKMVIFAPASIKSQVVFNSRVAGTLSTAGHDITLVLIETFDGAKSNLVKISDRVRVRYINASSGLNAKDFDDKLEKVLFKDLTLWDFKYLWSVMMTMLTESCRKILENKGFLSWLEAEKFDLAFAYVGNFCPVGIIHHAKIPAWIWLNSAPLVDFVAYYMGVPLIPSYVPPVITSYSDRMSFFERTKSAVGHVAEIALWKWFVVDKETTIFREKISPNFPDLADLAKTCPLVMVNTNELYDYPRPSLAKIVNIGGVGYQMNGAKSLEPELSRIVNASIGIILFSFGSVVPSDRMPLHWKIAFIEAFKRYPDYHFFWRYVGTDITDKLPPNVHIYEWLPQSDILQNEKTKAFITHGGYNSLQEAILAGVPLLVIPMAGDQPRNAKFAETHRFAVTLQKDNINVDAVAHALSRILTDQSYTRTVKRLSRMVKMKPVTASHLLISWSEFVAEFKTLDNLVPAGTKLNFFQYHSLDVIAFLLLVAMTILFVLWKSIKFIALRLFSLIAGSRKTKRD